MIKAVIFDMDGLMIDSEPIQSKSFEYVLRTHDKAPIFNPNGLIQTIGITAKDNWILLKEKHNLTASVASLLAKKRSVYGKLLKENVKPQKGLFSLIKKLKKGGFKLGIASSSKLSNIKLVLSSLHLSRSFDVILSGESLTRGKPHPDIFLETARKLSVDPSDCVVLEDAESGVEAAHRAKMKVIAVPNKFTRDHDFKKADLVVSSLGKITPRTLRNRF
ncbi:MAG: HAD family phosphatase [Minisyncoccia bacterium]|jgi:HAD superfamily hydrolase (TIGR01509 family)